jgi:(E)-4-hydroxy-3-methylbut-2-enyl-diphosphate synthase
MVESGLDHIKLLQDNDFTNSRFPVKASDVFLAAAAYQQLAEATDAPIHLGITEAGGLMSGTVKSAIGLGNLLWMGIGDTIRVSLSADPVEEVKVGFEILKSLGLRHRGVTIISCPSCARQGFDVIKTVSALEERLAHITTSMSLSIIGCVVNGPGRGADDRHRLSPAAGRARGWSIWPASRATAGQRPDDRAHRRTGRKEGRRDRGPATISRIPSSGT